MRLARRLGVVGAVLLVVLVLGLLRGSGAGSVPHQTPEIVDSLAFSGPASGGLSTASDAERVSGRVAVDSSGSADGLVAVSVRVINVDGECIPGIGVALHSDYVPRLIEALTDSDGFVRARIAPGSCAIDINKRMATHASMEGYLAVVEIVGAAADFEIVLRSIDSGLRVRVVDQHGSPVGGIAVSAWDPRVAGVTGVDGVAELLVPQGMLWVELDALPSGVGVCLPKRRARSISVRGPLMEETFTVLRSVPVQFLVTPAAAGDERVLVTLTPAVPQSESDYDLAVVHFGVPPLEGACSASVAPGLYKMHVECSAAGAYWAPEDSAVAVTMHGNPVIPISLGPAPGIVSGRITAHDGVPVSDIEVRVAVGGQSKCCRTGGDGRFLIYGVPLGVCQVGVIVQRFASRQFAANSQSGLFEVASDFPDGNMTIMLPEGYTVRREIGAMDSGREYVLMRNGVGSDGEYRATVGAREVVFANVAAGVYSLVNASGVEVERLTVGQ